MTKFNLENRFDLLTGEVLECKSPDSYHLHFFKDKRNMKKYFLNAIENKTPEVIQKFILDVYKEYIDLKKIQFAPHFVETSTIKVLPNAETVEKYYIGGYSKLIKDLGVDSFLKYDNFVFPENNIPQDVVIIQDSREQKAIQTKFKTIIKKLDFGDYAIERDNQKVFLERKSSNDLWNSVSSNKSFERFCREIERARQEDKYIIILCESCLTGFLYADYAGFRKATSDFVAHRLRELCRKFPKHLQLYFAQGRKDAAKLIPYFLYYDKEIFQYDLQFAYQKGLIKL